MVCKICGSEKVKIVYEGIIRDGGLGKYTDDPVKVWRCMECNAFWHDQTKNLKQYYESNEYRESLEGTVEERDFYELHDKESLDKFKYTGTTIFRDKVVADIGCGCGAFLDYIKGVAQSVIGIEPTQKYRTIMERKGVRTYAYADDAKKEGLKGKIDVVMSFDVIEHVESPQNFIEDYYDLLTDDGIGIIGTPTDAPIMRNLLGEIYERKQLFSTQHLWILGEENLKIMVLRPSQLDFQLI